MKKVKLDTKWQNSTNQKQTITRRWQNLRILQGAWLSLKMPLRGKKPCFAQKSGRKKCHQNKFYMPGYSICTPLHSEWRTSLTCRGICYWRTSLSHFLKNFIIFFLYKIQIWTTPKCTYKCANLENEFFTKLVVAKKYNEKLQKSKINFFENWTKKNQI